MLLVFDEPTISTIAKNIKKYRDKMGISQKTNYQNSPVLLYTRLPRLNRGQRLTRELKQLEKLLTLLV